MGLREPEKQGDCVSLALVMPWKKSYLNMAAKQGTRMNIDVRTFCLLPMPHLMAVADRPTVPAHISNMLSQNRRSKHI